MTVPHPQGFPSTGRLMSIPEAAASIRSGRFLCIAGDETPLRKLPAGNWIGGTSPYFMDETGGTTDRERVFVCELPVGDTPPDIRFYDVSSLPNVCVNGPGNGYTLIILPAFSDTHVAYARGAADFRDMFVKPIAGWISGVHLDELDTARPAVVDGRTGHFDHDRAVVMHVPLPPDRYARIDIVNGLQQGDGDRIRFPHTGFSADACFVNGTATNLADYFAANQTDTRLPLVADYCGAQINVSIAKVDTAAHRVDFYAPVFNDVEYRLAAPPGDACGNFADTAAAAFSCNCILNYLYDGLEGRRTGSLTGPMTFGEIAYLLLNQTLVYLTIEPA